MSDIWDIMQAETPADGYQQLMEMLREYLDSPADLDLIDRAFAVAERAHHSQQRASQEPFLFHPLNVAATLARLRMDPATIAAALLHDAVEDGPVTAAQIGENLGTEVAGLVQAVTKLAALDGRGDEPGLPQEEEALRRHEENLRKVILSIASDIRVILIKLADRLHNMQTLDSLAEPRRRAISRETLDILAPIAGRLGLWEFKWRLEDLAFCHLMPEEYAALAQQVALKRRQREQAIASVTARLDEELPRAELQGFAVEGRPKHLYGIHRKMQRKRCGLDDIYDLLAVRVITERDADCYTALGVVHRLWPPIAGRFKDYVARPKSNNYRSIHTTAFGPDGTPVEFQIRSRSMHEVDERGVAAHWAYKEGRAPRTGVSGEVYPWVKRLLDLDDESRDAREYIANVRLDLLDGEVLAFTPRGQVVDLPQGAVPLDFAYRIHSLVGHRYAGARVNSRIVTIGYQLRNADIVEIILGKRENPSLDWLQLAKTRHARSKIRQWFKRERREQNLAKGRELLISELKQRQVDLSVNDAALLGRVAERLRFRTPDEMLIALGWGELRISTLLRHLVRELPPEARERLTAQRRATKTVAAERLPQPSVMIFGMDDISFRLSRCCGPIQGDDVIGYIAPGRGVSVHRKTCPNMARLALKPERLVAVEWGAGQSSGLCATDVVVEAAEDAAAYSQVLQLAGDLGLHPQSVRISGRNHRAFIRLSLQVPSAAALEGFISQVRRLAGVLGVTRPAGRKKGGRAIRADKQTDG